MKRDTQASLRGGENEEETPHGHTRPQLIDGKAVTGFWALMNVVGGVAGLTALIAGAIAWGVMLATVNNHERRIMAIETSGSPNVQVQIKALTLEAEIRRNADDAMDKRLMEMRSDISQRITNITGLLEKLVEQQTRLISLIDAQQQIHNKP